jgi:predicted alpha-1,6-mannanase (GH76 family)
VELGAHLAYVDSAQDHTNAVAQMEAIGLVSPDFQVFDGSDSNINCTQLDHMQWSYNGGVMLLGAATMWNQVRPFVFLQG